MSAPVVSMPPPCKGFLYLSREESHCHFSQKYSTAALGTAVEKLGHAIVVLSQIDIAIRAVVATRIHVILVIGYNHGVFATLVRSGVSRVGRRRVVSGVSFATHGDGME